MQHHRRGSTKKGKGRKGAAQDVDESAQVGLSHKGKGNHTERGQTQPAQAKPVQDPPMVVQP